MNSERFSDPALLILTCLAGGERHGYAIMEEARALSGVAMGPGTLYGALARLEERGLIEAAPGDAAQPRRRPYRLTASGADALREEMARLARLTSLALSRLERTPS